MAFATLNVTVGTSAALIKALTTVGSQRSSVTIYNNGTATIYVGPAATVTAAAGSDLGGIPVPAGASFTLDKAPSASLYAISGTAGQDVRVFTEEGS